MELPASQSTLPYLVGQEVSATAADPARAAGFLPLGQEGAFA
jgi:hypothetical protein